MEILGLPLQEAMETRDPTQADSAHPEQSSQSPVQAVPSSGDSQPDDPPDRGTGSSSSQKASQDHLSEQGAEDSRPETDGVPGDHGQKEHLPSSDSEGEKPDRGAPKEGGAQRTTGAGLPGGPQEEGDGIPYTPASAPTLGPALGLCPAFWCLEPGSVAQGFPDPQQTLSRMGREGEGTHSNLGCSSLGMVIIADLSRDPAELEERALEVAGPDGQASAMSPASPKRKAADGGYRRALPGCTPLSGETAGETGEAGQDDKPPGDVPVGPTASLALAPGSGESMMGAGDSDHAAMDTGPCVDQKQEPGPTPEAAESGGQDLKQDLEGLRVSPQASVLPEHREAADSPLQEPGAQQGIPDTTSDLAGQQDHLPHPADQAAWADSSAVELDFLLDSQIQDALDASDFETPPEQVRAAPSDRHTCPGQAPNLHKPSPHMAQRWRGTWGSGRTIYTANDSRSPSCSSIGCGVGGFPESIDLPFGGCLHIQGWLHTAAFSAGPPTLNWSPQECQPLAVSASVPDPGCGVPGHVFRAVDTVG